MRFKTADWQLWLFCFGILWVVHPLLTNLFYNGVIAGLLIWFFIDSFANHFIEWNKEHQAETLKVFG